MNTKLPVQVDGEPWLQPPCSVTIIKSALKVSIFKIQTIITTDGQSFKIYLKRRPC